ncbi:MAG: DUF4136 domain-containing protein [Sphingomonadales bacterium]|nr:DUF4136 domain-containing protein [Sphingomonadales bacterium]
MTTNPAGRFAQWLRLLLLPFLFASLAACAENFDAKVTRFQSQLPPPAGQSFAIVPEDPALNGSLEFGQYSRLVAAQLLKAGYSEASGPAAASLLVRFDYGVDKGREHIRESAFARDPFWGPWYGWHPGGYWGRGFYGPGYGRGFYPRGGWGFGWYDPWFDNGVESYTVYTSGVSLKIDAKDGPNGTRRLFEGKAEAASTSNRLPYLVPNLVEAMFTGFPGNSGETVRITIAPEKQAAKRP